MNEKMKAARLHGEQDLRLDEVDIPEPGEGEVLIKVKRAGICGSDMHYFEHGKCGSFVPKRPFTLGHEFGGEVVKHGPSVNADKLPLGSRVAVDPSRPNYSSDFSREGRYNLCLEMRYLGSASTDPHMDGAFANYIAIPEKQCYILPENMDYAMAALMEPFAVSLFAAKRAGDIRGKSVLVTGAGPIGLLAMLAAKEFGASVVAISDIKESARNVALKMGADQVINPMDDKLMDQVNTYTKNGFDVIIECSGAAPAINSCFELVRRGGTIVQVGTIASEQLSIPYNMIMAKELTVTGSFRFANVFETAIQLVSSGKVDLTPMISEVYQLDEINKAMSHACSRDNVVKIHLEMD